MKYAKLKFQFKISNLDRKFNSLPWKEIQVLISSMKKKEGDQLDPGHFKVSEKQVLAP